MIAAGRNDQLKSQLWFQPVDEAIERMYQLFPDVTNDALLRCEIGPMDEFCREFSVRVRMKLRMQVSNEWMRPENSPLAETYVRNGVPNPEEMSYALMDAYVQYIKARD